MDWIVIEGVRPYDGRYPFDIGDVELTTREWGWIKKFSGYLPLTIEDGFRGADAELYAALAAIALRRAARIDARIVADVFDRLCDAPFGSAIRVETDDDDDVVDVTPDPPASLRAKRVSSGTELATSSETSTDRPSPYGTPDSDSLESPPTELAN